MSRENITESIKVSQSMKDSTASEESGTRAEVEEHLLARVPPRQ